MSENINFIPANELPVAEGDEVSVLCLENGELKQKYASGLGGNTNYDIVVRIVSSYDDENDDRFATAEIISGSFDAVVQKIDSGVMPTALVMENGFTWDNKEIKSVWESYPAWYKFPDEEEPCLYIEAWASSGYLYADGTFEFD